jgi:hypothetical protein
MDVLGHEDIAEEEELMTVAESFEPLFKYGAGVVIVQIGEAAVTTEGEEVVVAFGLITLQTTRHGLCGSEPWYSS